MSNREPFWWPMNEPPLPNHPANLEAGWPWIETSPSGVNFIRVTRRVTPEDLQVDPSVTEHAANHERVMQITRRIIKRDAELLERLADD